jgi:uncharacterized protein DUF4337
MSHNPTEHVQEEIQHHASHGHDEHEAGGKWITASATTAAIVAAFAAGAGALATSHETQSSLIAIRANDEWNYYQAKSIKFSLLDAKIYSAQLSKAEPRKADEEKRAKYQKEMPEIQVRAHKLEKLSTQHLETHEAYEGAATLFHIAIAIVAISVVARRKEFWYISMVVGFAGLLVFGEAFLYAPPHLKEEEETPSVQSSNASEHAPKGPAAAEGGETSESPAAAKP